MKRFISLVDFELRRVWKMYLGLVVLLGVTQVSTSVRSATAYRDEMKRGIQAGTANLDSLWLFSKVVDSNMWILFSIMFSFSALFFYMFFIWYRDWVGKNRTIYRLFMLPTSRMTVYFSKMITIFLLAMGLVCFQIMFMFMVNAIVENIVPTGLYLGEAGMESILTMYSSFFQFVMPPEPMLFFVIYTVGFTIVCMVFTVILLERAFKWKGILVGVGCVVLLLVIPMSIIGNGLGGILFYSSDKVFALLTWSVVVSAMSIGSSNLLLTKKVSV